MTINFKSASLVLCGLALVGLAATAMAIGTSGSTDNPPGFVPVQHARGNGSIESLTLTITSVTSDGALEEIVARLGDEDITAAEVRVVPETESNAGGRVAFLTVKTPAPGPAAAQDLWLAELAAGALRDVASVKGLALIDNFEVAAQLPDGEIVPINSGFGNVARAQQFDTSTDAAIRARIEKGLRSVGLEPLSVSTVSALQLSPVVVARSDDPASFVRRATLASFWEEMLGDYLNYEGYYFELRDADDQPAVIATAAHRAGASASWTRADLRRDTRMNPIVTGDDGG